jgi:hypothetical protein
LSEKQCQKDEMACPNYRACIVSRHIECCPYRETTDGPCCITEGESIPNIETSNRIAEEIAQGNSNIGKGE